MVNRSPHEYQGTTRCLPKTTTIEDCEGREAHYPYKELRKGDIRATVHRESCVRS